MKHYRGFVPGAKDQSAIDNYRYKHPVCEVCGHWDVQVHHVRPLRYSGTNHESNLITLCRPHHLVAHAILRKDIAGLTIKPVMSLFRQKDINGSIGLRSRLIALENHGEDFGDPLPFDATYPTTKWIPTGDVPRGFEE